MLVLSRKTGEKVRIGNAITLTVLSMQRGKIRIGIEAPGQLPVYREELVDWNGDAAPDPAHIVQAHC